jgi:universal stress protein F
MYDTIVIATALFDEGRAPRTMTEKARHLLNPGGRVILVHVLEDIPQYAAAHVPRTQLGEHQRRVREMLEALAAEIDGASTEVVVRSGRASAGILETAEESGADLIMIASHKPGLSDYLIGSTAARVVRHARTSVLVLR